MVEMLIRSVGGEKLKYYHSYIVITVILWILGYIVKAELPEVHLRNSTPSSI